MESIEDGDSAPDVKLRLAEAWSAHGMAETCGVLVSEVSQRCVQWLLRKFHGQGLSHEDCEDCFNDGVEGLLKWSPEQVKDPYNYVFTSALNAAYDVLSERKHIVQYDPSWTGPDDESFADWSDAPQTGKVNWSPEAMLIVAEVSVDAELSVRDEQLKAIFRTALLKLAPSRRRLVEALLEHRANIANAVLADIMGRSESAVKSLKSRTFDDLRRLLPITADELGINFDSLIVPEPEVLANSPVIPSDEDGPDFMP